jgi:hypothetical protein
VLGNPIRARCHFRVLYDLAKAGTPGYAAYNLSAFESPHAGLTTEEVIARGLPRGLVDRSWIEDKRLKYGEGSLYWRTRVLAVFPDEDYDQLIPADWLDRCLRIARAAGATAPCVIVDIAKGTGRDRTVVLVGDLLGLHEVLADSRVGVHEAAGLAVDVARRRGVRPEHVVYDAGGWAGSDMRRYLDQYGYHAARPYHGGSPTGGGFANVRSRSAWRLRQRLDPERPLRVRPTRVDPYQPPRTQPAAEAVVKQPPWHVPASLAGWNELREELLELRYGHKGHKLALEPKEDLVARLGRSPDLGDCCLMLASLWPDDD